MRERLSGLLAIAIGLASAAAGANVPQAAWQFALWAISLILFLAAGFLLFLPRTKRAVDTTKMGHDNTIVGNVTVPANLGGRNTIVGATDDEGNTIINRPTSIGAGAGFDPAGVIIGSGAGANLGKTEDQ